MKYRERVEELAGLIEGVEGAGFVHARTRVSDGTWSDFLAKFTDGDGQANGWMVTRKAGEKRDGSVRWSETYTATKILRVNDAQESDLVFQQNVEDVLLLFIEGRGLSFGFVVDDDVRLPSAEVRDIGGVLCHVAELEIKVQVHPSQML